MSAAVVDRTPEFGRLEYSFLAGSVGLGLAVSYLLGSPVGMLMGLLPAIATIILRRPSTSIIAFILINTVITLRPKDETSLGAPNALDLALGVLLALIMAYWFIKVRVFDFQPLSSTTGELLLILFLGWSAFVTLVGVTTGEAGVSVGLRELLNIVPAAFFPFFYSRFIKSNSREETWIFGTVSITAVAFLIGNIIVMRSHLAQAYFLYQIGRGSFDITFEPFIILLIVSAMMTIPHRTKWLLLVPVMLLAFIALIISMSRNLYVATPIATAFVLVAGASVERRRALGRLALTVLTFIAISIPFYLTNSLFRLLTTHYIVRFLSTRALKKDRSIGERLAEWQGIWGSIKESPIIGHGFGSKFRFFETVFLYHVWQPFSHSSYLYIFFKTGFVGGMLFFSAFILLSLKGLKLLRNPLLTSRETIVVRASCAFLIIMLFSAYMGPVFDSKADMTWLGLVWGYFLAVNSRVKSSMTPLREAIVERGT